MTRYDMVYDSPEMEVSPDGEWVRYTDHTAEVERLTARAEELQHALRLAIAGKPVRNADELLAADKEGT